MYGALRDGMDAWGSTMARGRALWPVVQGSLVGGTTVINSAIAVRTPGDIFNQWRDEIGIPTHRLQPSVERIQDELERELGAQSVPLPALGRHNLLALRGSKKLGVEGHVIRRYVKRCQGKGSCLQGCRAGNKQSLNLTFVPEVLLRGGYVLSCAPVERILMDGSRAVGVTGRFRHPTTRRRGATFRLRARRGVVVAASVTRSPLLLQRSGVRSPMLGEGFRAHPGAPILGFYDEPVDMNSGATQGWASLAYRDAPGFKLESLSLPLDMVAGRLPGGGQVLMERLREYRHIAVWVQVCRAESVGRVTTNLFGRPEVRYSLDRADMVRFRQGLVAVARTHFAAGARAIIPGVYGLPYKLGPDDIGLLETAPLEPRAYVSILTHLFGGCIMGPDPGTSVCDPAGRVHGYDGLYVADASVIPTNLGVNPQHTIMALSRHFAEEMLGAEQHARVA
jgi:choline dehydrogenase-like flavoprotein